MSCILLAITQRQCLNHQLSIPNNTPDIMSRAASTHTSPLLYALHIRSHAATCAQPIRCELPHGQKCLWGVTFAFFEISSHPEHFTRENLDINGYVQYNGQQL